MRFPDWKTLYAGRLFRAGPSREDYQMGDRRDSGEKHLTPGPSAGAGDAFDGSV